MASQFSAEDQTDEDFFDKLVEDEFPVAQPVSFPKTIARESSNSNLSFDDSDAIDNASTGTGTETTTRISNLSLDDKDPAFETSEISNLNYFSNKDATFESPEASNVNLEDTSNKGANLEKRGEELGLPDSPMEKSGSNSKVSVKQVQWSVFGSGSQFGSDSDPFTIVEENPIADQFGTQSIYASKSNDNTNINAQVYENQDLGASFYSNQNETEQVQVDSNWENQYPGWKYDYTTGSWYQVDNVDPNSTSNTQVAENSNLNSEIVYQQSAHPVLETIAEEITGPVNSITGTEYPPNMIFDPNYPDWYYDTNTQQWYALESYQPVPVPVQEEANQEQSAQIQNQNQNQDQNKVPLGQLLSSGFSGDWRSYTENPNPSENSQSYYGDNTNALMPSVSGSSTHLSASYHGENANLQTSSFYGTNSNTGGNFVNTDLSGSFYGTNTASKNQGFKSFEPATVTKFQPQSFVQGQFGPNNVDVGPTQGRNFANFDTGSVVDSVPTQGSFVNFNQNDFNQSNVGPTQGNFVNFNQNDFNQSKGGFVNFNQSSVGPTQGNFVNSFNQGNVGNYSFNPNSEGRSSAGRPPHTLVTFGFGGKLIIMKDSSASFASGFNYSNKGNTSSNTISIHTMSEIIKQKIDDPNVTDQYGSLNYFKSLCHHSYPGPLVGSNAALKDVNKFIDERIASCESSQVDFQKGEYLKLLLGVLKIFCQHYGKLRSPLVSGVSQQDADGPEMALTKLFSSAKRSNYGSFGNCMQNMPSENQIRATALEVQNLLVSGKRKEALHLAQEGQLWGPALVLAAQLGDQDYAETVKKMAHRQFVPGSPLRTLCLLIAGQPSQIFSTDNPAQSALGTPKYAVSNASQPLEFQGGGMLDEWEENLAIMVANRTLQDNLVIKHLGDLLWKDKGEVTAAHTCYLVAEESFEPFSDKARVCLVGADHWKNPRTFASPDAIQRTELFEYAKVLGNAQYMLPCFQPYKLVYAHMLAEMGKLSDSLKYCQASLKILKSSRAPELETLKQQFSSLEEQIRTHQQGGFSSNAPTKMVKNLFSTLDRGIQRVMGTPAPPPPQQQQPSGLPPMVPGTTGTSVMSPNIGTNTSGMVNNNNNNNNQSMSKWNSMSRSVEQSMVNLDADNNNNNIINNNINNSGNKSFHSRSVSEPQFSQDEKTDSSKNNESGAGGSKLGRFGKIFSWIGAKPKNQAKLGEENKFYYDEKLKRWVLQGEAESAAEVAPLAPPPTFQNNNNNNFNNNNNNSMQNESYSMVNGSPEMKPSISQNNLSEAGASSNTGMPPAPPSHNQFSNRGRVGVRSRYVDTFNKGGTTQSAPKTQFQSPAIKPLPNAKFFVPTFTPTTTDNNTDSTSEIPQIPPLYNSPPPNQSSEIPPHYNSPPPNQSSEIAQIPPLYNSPPPKHSSPPSSIGDQSPPPPFQNYQNTPPGSFHRFPSMDNINKTGGANPGSNSGGGGGSRGNISRNRAASWSGSYNDPFGAMSAQMSPPNNNNMQFVNNNNNISSSQLHDEFNEVEL